MAVLESAAELIGDVRGPTGATPNAIARFDGTSGKKLKNSGVTISDADRVEGITSMVIDGTGTGDLFEVLRDSGASGYFRVSFDGDGAGLSSGPSNFRFLIGSSEAMRITSNLAVGIGTATVPVGGVTRGGKLDIYGTQANVAGPHTAWVTSQDDYPVMYFHMWQHDQMGILFDMYHNGAASFVSSDAGSNFMIYKYVDRLIFYAASGVAAGSGNGGALRKAFEIEPDGDVMFSPSQPYKTYWRDNAIYIASLNDGYLDVVADTGVRIGASTTVTTGSLTLGVNDTTPGALTIYGGTTGVRTGGSIYQYTGASYDDTVNSYSLTVYDANWEFRVNVTNVKYTYLAASDLFRFFVPLQMASGQALDCYTAGGYLKPRYLSQSGLPTPDTAEQMMWRDSDDGKVRLVYSDPTEGTRSVELAPVTKHIVIYPEDDGSALIGAATGGEDFELRPGTHTFSASVFLDTKNNVTIRGPREAIISLGIGKLISFSNCNDITISGVTIHRSAGGTVWTVFTGASGSGFHMHNVKCTGTGTYCVSVTPFIARHIKIESCIFDPTSATSCIYVNGQSGETREDISVHLCSCVGTCTDDAIQFPAVSGATCRDYNIHGNYVAGTHTVGIHADYVTDSTFRGNIIVGSTADGLRIGNVKETTIDANRIGGCDVGIKEDATCDRNIFDGNHARGNTTNASLSGTNRHEGDNYF